MENDGSLEEGIDVRGPCEIGDLRDLFRRSISLGVVNSPYEDVEKELHADVEFFALRVGELGHPDERCVDAARLMSLDGLDPRADRSSRRRSHLFYLSAGATTWGGQPDQKAGDHGGTSQRVHLAGSSPM